MTMILARPCSVAQRDRSSGTFTMNIRAVALREFREAVHSRWFTLYTIAFAALGLGVSYISAASAGATGVTGFGRTSAGLINLVILIVPLMALTAGAGSIASDRERGMLAYLLAQPVSRAEIVLGKYLGLATALVTSLFAGFGACAAVLAAKSATTDAGGFVWMVALTVGLMLAMLSVGFLISALARKASVATGSAVFTWLVVAFGSDLGLMAGTLAWKLPIRTLFGVAIANPCQVFKMWSLVHVDASLDVLGPAGLYATDTFGASLGWMFTACLAGWCIAPLAVTLAVFSRRSPV